MVEEGPACQELLLDLLPLGIAGERDEEIWPTKLRIQSDAVVKKLLHKAWTALKGRREDDSLFAGLIACGGSIGVRISDCLVTVSANRLLVLLDPVESIAFNSDVSVADEVLQQSSAVEEAIELAGTALHQISVGN